MASYLQLLGGGDAQLSPGALLFFDARRYLFGSGEGTQRASTEHHVKLAKIEHVFLTRIAHDMVGGLTGEWPRRTDSSV